MDEGSNERPKTAIGGTPQAEKVYGRWKKQFEPVIKEGEDPQDKKPIDELLEAPESLNEVDKHVWRRHYEAVQDHMTDYRINIIEFREYAREEALARTEIELKGETDALTGLRNRNGLKRAIEDLKGTSKRGDLDKRPKCIFIRADANGLRDINNRLGHKAGDEFLKKFGEAFEKVRGGDIAARDGGDEFGIVLMNTDFDGATSFWNRFASELPEELSIVGGAWELDFDDIEGSMHNADLQMYQAKAESKDSTEGNMNFGKNILRFPTTNAQTEAAA